MKHTVGEIAFTTDGVLMSDDGKPLVCHENSPNRPREESRANRAHLCLCWNLHSELLQHARMLEKSLLYEIRKDEKSGDDEGARMKSVVLHDVCETLRKAGV